MPVWPFLIAITAILTLWGWRHSAWEVPAIALCGYIAMRVIVTYAPVDFLEVAGCASWLFFASLMVYKGGAVPGFFYALSALTYPVLLTVGFRIEHMGLSPVIAEIFAACALLSIGGGIYGMAHASGDLRGPVAGLQNPALDVAMQQEGSDINIS